MGSFMRSSSAWTSLNSGESTTSQGSGLVIAWRRCSTMPSFGTLRAAAIFSLVENRLPTALPPLRSSNTTVFD